MSANDQYKVHLLRTTQQHHVALSGMADQKANIMIGASLILLTFLSSQLNGGRANPAFIALAVTAALAGLFAVLVVLPRASRIDAKSPHFNLLFFGHFTQLDRQEFCDRVLGVMDNDESTYRAMAADIYGMGQVLRRKYAYLAWSYRVFLVGWLLAVLLYLFQALF